MFPDVRGVPDEDYQRHPGSIYIDEIREKLYFDFPEGVWVAADVEQRVIFDETIDGLFIKMSEMSDNLQNFAIAFVTEDSV